MTAYPDVHAPAVRAHVAPRNARRVRHITIRRRVEVITMTRWEMGASLLASVVLGAIMGVCLLAMIH